LTSILDDQHPIDAYDSPAEPGRANKRSLTSHGSVRSAHDLAGSRMAAEQPVGLLIAWAAVSWQAI
jgi:hypothetical protein